MLLVKAIEHSIRQTESIMETWWRCGVVGLPLRLRQMNRSLLEQSTSEGDSPVGEVWKDLGSLLSTVYWILCGNFGRHQLPTLNTSGVR